MPCTLTSWMLERLPILGNYLQFTLLLIHLHFIKVLVVNLLDLRLLTSGRPSPLGFHLPLNPGCHIHWENGIRFLSHDDFILIFMSGLLIIGSSLPLVFLGVAKQLFVSIPVLRSSMVQKFNFASCEMSLLFLWVLIVQNIQRERFRFTSIIEVIKAFKSPPPVFLFRFSVVYLT